MLFRQQESALLLLLDRVGAAGGVDGAARPAARHHGAATLRGGGGGLLLSIATTSPPPSHLVLMSGLLVRGETSDGIGLIRPLIFLGSESLPTWRPSLQDDLPHSGVACVRADEEVVLVLRYEVHATNVPCGKRERK